MRGQGLLTRRSFVAGAAAAWFSRGLAQTSGMAGGATKAQTRRPATGRPYASFTDVSAQAGLNAVMVYGGVERIKFIVESMGGGCAFLDYDNDGWIDIFILGGRRLEGAPPGASNRLYRNNRDGTFTDVTLRAGLQGAGWACGVCVGDYDNDGFEDIFCTYYGQNRLYRNKGDGTFTDVTKECGLLDPVMRFGTGCSFFDYNRDGHLDLFVANYVEFDLRHPPVPTIANPTCSYEGMEVYCGPRGLKAGRHSLYRNNGDGTFTDVSESSGIAKHQGSYGMTAVTADFDNDGWPDIFLACDSTPSLLLMNNHDGTFREEGFDRGVAVSEEGVEQAGMGVGVGDIGLNGGTSLLVTHFQKDASGLFLNHGDGQFTDVTFNSRLAVETRFVGWGAAIADFDNDGLPDLFWVNGNVYPEVERKYPQFPFKGPRILFRNLGDGTFEELTTEAGPALAQKHASRGLAIGDFDNDGDLDILIMNVNEAPSLLRNDAPAKNHWIKFKLTGTKSNRSAIGARVTVRYGGRVQMQELLSQASYLSSNDPRLHFGLGAVTEIEADVAWPSGRVEKLGRLAVDRVLTVKEGDGPAKPASGRN
ncbi:MAG TPA: CRTAC1 family protein [Acidobacteriaceae bacterium]